MVEAFVFSVEVAPAGRDEDAVDADGDEERVEARDKEERDEDVDEDSPFGIDGFAELLMLGVVKRLVGGGGEDEADEEGGTDGEDGGGDVEPSHDVGEKFGGHGGGPSG